MIGPVTRARSTTARLLAKVATESSPSVSTVSPDPSSPVEWEAHWWPVNPVCCLDKQRPQAVMILGVSYVVWWDKAAEAWRVFDDACPHRLAPLSEGRITPDGELMCSYHGRTFGGCGTCSSIPQADAEFKFTPRLNAASFPTQVRAGLLFAWLQDGAEAEAAAAAAPPPPVPVKVEQTDGLDWGASVVHNDYMYWVEQFMDPTHAPYLHHTMSSNGAGGILKQEQAIPFEADLLPPSKIQAQGFTWRHGGYSVLNQGMQATREFLAPSCASVAYRLAGSTEPRIQHVFVVPLAPGKSRIFYRFYVPPKTALGRAVRALEEALLPRAVRHSLALARRDDHAITDQDVLMMHKEEAIMRYSGRTKDSYMANLPADRGVMGAHRWLDLAGYAAMWARRMPHPEPWRQLSEAELMDRWSRHVGHCVMCQQTMAWAKRAEEVLSALATGALALAAGLCIFAVSHGHAPAPAAAAKIFAASGVAVLFEFLARKVRTFIQEQFVSGLPRYARNGGLSFVANKPTGLIIVGKQYL